MRTSSTMNIGLLDPAIRRGLWVGGAIGLYFGWFFRPVREPSLVIAIVLSLLIATVLLVISAIRHRGGNSWRELGRSFLLNTGKYMLVISALEMRHFVYDWGGRTACLIVGGLLGMAMGAWFSWDQSRSS